MQKQYDILRVFCTLLVVLGHTTIIYGGEGILEPAVSSSALSLFAWHIYSFHMPLFMILSGCVYGVCTARPGGYTAGISLIYNKAKRLLIPYYFFGIFYAAPVVILLHLTDQSFPEYIFNGIILAGNTRHLWYLLTLFEIFVVCSIPGANALLSSIPGLTGLFLLSCLSGHFPRIFGIHKLAYYLLFFYAGFAVHRNMPTLLRFVKQNKLKAAFLCLVTFAVSLPLSTVQHGGRNIVSIMISIPPVISYMILACSLSGSRLTHSRIFDLLHENSMGIYLFHPMILYIIIIRFYRYTAFPLLFCICAFMAALLLSILFSRVLVRLRLGFLMGVSSLRPIQRGLH